MFFFSNIILLTHSFLTNELPLHKTLINKTIITEGILLIDNTNLFTVSTFHIRKYLGKKMGYKSLLNIKCGITITKCSSIHKPLTLLAHYLIITDLKIYNSILIAGQLIKSTLWNYAITLKRFVEVMYFLPWKLLWPQMRRSRAATMQCSICNCNILQ